MQRGLCAAAIVSLLVAGCGGEAPTKPHLTGAVAVSIGKAHACAITGAGTAECWGGDAFGELGDGRTTFAVPAANVVANLPAVNVMVAGASYTCARRTDGGVSCWGGNVTGEVGNGSVVGGLPGSEAGAESVTTPVSVTGLSGPAVTLATGAFYDSWSGCTCALLTGGTVECWGQNVFALGPDPAAVAIAPTAVPGLTDAIAIAVSGGWGCAVRSDQTVACWGLGQLGQPGPTTSSSSTSPVPVYGIDGAVAVAVGSFHGCALLGTGAVACWGDNLLGSLGDGTSHDSPTPVMVNHVTGAVALAAAGFQTCALLGDGTVKCWGGDAGMLTPAAVPGLRDAVSISVSVNAACAVVSGGEVRCWGQNDSGQLGTGTPPDPSAPSTRVNTPVTVVAGP